ncbi:MAG: hypothetical protein IJN82_07200 [Clostridia bacterium]|nr:hypothetical protein [Clostridia bacterium]MBQ7090890.1 hypothetical protein [Clostridia bacterium]
MSLSEDLFIEGKEGRLTKREPSLLIVMKEPHADKLDCFWMQKVLNKEEKGARYYNVLGAFARHILNKETHREALAQCAYINLFPFWGEKCVQSGKGYSAVMDADKDGEVGEICEESTHKAILANRFAIIKSALDSGISVAAHKEIVGLLAKEARFGLTQLADYTKEAYPLACYDYAGGRAKVYALPHPAGRISYKKLKDALGKEIRAED